MPQQRQSLIWNMIVNIFESLQIIVLFVYIF